MSSRARDAGPGDGGGKRPRRSSSLADRHEELAVRLAAAKGELPALADYLVQVQAALDASACPEELLEACPLPTDERQFLDSLAPRGGRRVGYGPEKTSPWHFGEAQNQFAVGREKAAAGKSNANERAEAEVESGMRRFIRLNGSKKISSRRDDDADREGSYLMTVKEWNELPLSRWDKVQPKILHWPLHASGLHEHVTLPPLLHGERSANWLPKREKAPIFSVKLQVSGRDVT